MVLPACLIHGHLHQRTLNLPQTIGQDPQSSCRAPVLKTHVRLSLADTAWPLHSFCSSNGLCHTGKRGTTSSPQHAFRWCLAAVFQRTGAALAVCTGASSVRSCAIENSCRVDGHELWSVMGQTVFTRFWRLSGMSLCDHYIQWQCLQQGKRYGASYDCVLA